jgi:peptidoglycan/LPS O-acetylase OafA/YrhL
MVSALFLVIGLLGLCAFLIWKKPENTSSGKLGYLEGVRGLAALSVVICHFISAFFVAMVKGDPSTAHYAIEPLLAASPAYLFYSATLCVSIFFTLSGFVLSYGFFTKNDVSVIISQAGRRYIRLALPVLVTSAIYFLLITTGVLNSALYDTLAALTKNDFFNTLYHFQPSLIDVLKASLLDVFFFGQNLKYNFVLWTMFNELMGSALVFAFLLIFRKSTFRYFGYVIALLLSLGLLKSAQMPAFVLGILLCDLYVAGRLKALAHPAVRGLILLGAVYCCALNVFLSPAILADTPYAWLLFTLKWKKDLYMQGWQVVNIGSFLFLLSVLNSPVLQKALSSRVCLFLGKISFSMYLIHYMFIFGLTSYGTVWLTPHLGYAAATILSFVVSMPFMLGLSYVLYWVVDRASVVLSANVYNGLQSAWIKLKAPQHFPPAAQSISKVS